MSKRPRRSRGPAGRPVRPNTPSIRPSGDPIPAQTDKASLAGATEPKASGQGSTALTRATTARTTRRTTRGRHVEERSFFDRYRAILLAVFALVGVGIIGFVVFQQGTNAAGYTCDSLMTPAPSVPAPTAAPSFRPTPTPDPSPSVSAGASGSVSPSSGASPSGSAGPSVEPDGSILPSASVVPSGSVALPSASASSAPSPSPSPVPSPSGLAGFQTTDLGETHVPPGTSIDYTYCPPTSGTHYLVGPQAPMRQGFYEPEAATRPGGWVHNLEHGYIVVAYRGGADGVTAADLAELRDFVASAPPSTFAGSCPSIPNKAVAVRFDQMTTKFAILAWDRALLTDAWDADEAIVFYEQWVDSPQAPERGAC